MYTYSQHRFLKPPKVAGIRLRPLTLGHIDVLCGIGNPVADGKAPDVEHLASALFVCSRDWKNAAGQIRSGRALRWMRRIGRRFGNFGLAEAKAVFDAFAEYMEVYSMAPPRWEKGGETNPARVPWHLCIFSAIQEKTNFQPLETWDMPVARAFELFAAICANAGDDSLVSLAEMDLFEKMQGDDS